MRYQDETLHELIAEQAAEWYVAQRDGGLGESKQREFMRWLRKSPTHVAEYLSIAGLAHDMAGAARESTESLERLLAEAGAEGNVVSLDGDPLTPDPSPARGEGRKGKATQFPLSRLRERASAARGAERTVRVFLASRTIAIAATMLLAVAATLWFAVMPDRYATGHGEQRTWQLPDSTVVRLNSNSAIAVDFDEERRRVEVKRGQVYFEVAEDAARPFSVVAGSHLIEDIGTAFDVYRKQEQVTVTVVEGRVRVWNRDVAALPLINDSEPASGAEMEAPLADLQAGTQVRLASAGLVALPAPVDVQRVTAWMRNKIVFDKEPIADVAAEFNRYNHQQIHIADPDVGAITISGVFHTYDVRSFVQFLNRLPGVRAEQTEDRILVTAEPATRARSG